MIIGGHSVIYSSDVVADRAFFRDVLKFPNVDIGDGWLIFNLPPSELAVHPADKNGMHEFYLMCDDIEKFAAEMDQNRVEYGEIRNLGWGILVNITLPGGGKLGVYQPLPARA